MKQKKPSSKSKAAGPPLPPPNLRPSASLWWKVDTAEDGAVAWYSLQLKRYDLLITDHDMPHVTGFELLKKVRAARMPVPVIMATESLPKEEYRMFPLLQPAITLLHPYTTEEFLETVEGVLDATVNAPDQKTRQASLESQPKVDPWLL
jgi:two-component system chemotaxis response regulator CheY